MPCLGWVGSGKNIVRRSRRFRTWRLYAVCTRNPERLAEVAARFGVKKTYTDYHAMLADPEVESVSITTMWDQHMEPAVAALEAGKHVFLEKPMASTVADCDLIVDAANAAAGFFL